MKDLTNKQVQIDLVQQVVLCYEEFKKNPLETVEYLQKLEFLPMTDNKLEKSIITIDPPSGWKYGFPKPITKEEYKSIKSLKQWCIDNGYPKLEADSYGKYFHIQVNGNLNETTNS